MAFWFGRIPALLDFLLSYSDQLVMSLLVWPVASMVLTFPILIYLYHRDGKLKATSVLSTYLLVLYVLGLFFFTCSPFPSGDSGLGITYGVQPQLNPLGFIGYIAKDGLSAIPQIVCNVVFFMPFGFLCCRLLRLSKTKTVILSLLVSLLIETTQLTGIFGMYEYAYRTFDVCDLYWNVTGGFIGYLVAELSFKAVPRCADVAEPPTHPSFLHRSTAFVLDWILILIATVVVTTFVSLLMSILGIEHSLGIMAYVFGLVVIYDYLIHPMMFDGFTIAGRIVNLRCDTERRSSGRRLEFLTIRLIYICTTMMLSPIFVPFTLLFYAFARKMPYDYVGLKQERMTEISAMTAE